MNTQDAQKTLDKAATINPAVSSAQVPLQQAMEVLRKERDERYADALKTGVEREYSMESETR